MKIRTQLIFTLSLFGLMLIGMAVSLFLTSQQVDQLRQQEEIAHRIERRANELSYLSGDYLMYGERQQRVRWESSFAAFSADISKLDPVNSEEQVTVDHIKADQGRLQAIFTDVVSTIEGSTQTSGGVPGPAFNQVSWSRIEVQNRSIAFEASLLSRQLRDQADQLKQMSSMLIFILISSFGAYLLINYYLIDQRTLRSIAALQSGTAIIGSGDLDFTIAVKRADEIGELSYAINRMAADLKEVTASKADLEREIAERKQAEAALQDVNEELQVIAEELRQQNDEILRTQIALSESEERYRTLVENAPIGIYEIDLISRKLITVNDVLCSVTGYSRQELLSMDALDLLVGEHKTKFINRIQTLISGQQVPGIIEYQVRVKSGAVRWALLNVNFTLTDGIPVLARVTATDITERKKAEEALQESEAKYRNLFENMTEEVHFWQLVRDEAGQIKTWRLVDANPPTLKTWGRQSVDEIRGKTTDEIFGPGATEHYMPVVQKIMTEGLPHTFEDYFPNLDKYFRFTSVPLDDHFITTGADITAIRKSEDVLRQKEAELREAQRIAHIGSWYWNAKTDVTTGSDELLHIYGFDPAMQAMLDFNDQRGQCYPVADWERVNAAVQMTLETGVGYELDVQAIRDDKLIWITTRSEVVHDAKGEIIGLRGTVQDITERKQAQAELEESTRELFRSNQNLEQFAYVASHDLQEPLRIMSSYSQLLERRYKDRLDQDANEFIDFIVDAAARMQKLIMDLLTYSRAGRETTDIGEVDCSKVIRRLVAGMAATIESMDGQVTFGKLPIILAHESSIIQLFQNLISNAIKFRGKQPPCIHVSARQSDSEWIFAVRDNGIGIEPQYRERIFMIFQRLHPREKYPGTGIGLSICQKIVETLGGRIWVESEPGQGSTFYFTVPNVEE